jgi:class 3 adenylate cyclase
VECPACCPACGRTARDGAAFCDGCGGHLAPAACPACGAAPRAGARFCDGCGHRLAESAPPARAEGIPVRAEATEGVLVASRYRVLRLLGEGAKKRVYLAQDLRLDREVAVALIKTEGLDETGRARIHREVQAMGRLGDHPQIVTVHDVGEVDGQPYIVAQYMAGGDLSELLRREPEHRLAVERALRVAAQVARALEHAHARGIVHRDVKPGNVWLTAQGDAKLGDFGLAVSLEQPRLTLEGMMVGTVAYMAPEQALGTSPDARCDLYALGAMLYEMLTGRPPFLGDDAVSIISQHINTPPVAPSWHRPDLPRALEAMVLRLLAKAPEDRPASAADVAAALASVEAVAAAPEPAPSGEGEANPLDRLAAGVFVGREAELDQLRAALEDALSGRGRMALLVGEPGIGKTRTAEELCTYARLRRCQVLVGRCYEGEGAPPYWPFVQAIRTYAHEREPKGLLSELGSGAAEVAELVSEVRERLPGLPRPAPADPQQARFRLFDGVTTFLRNASREQPLVVVLDDLHWADRPTLLLLQFFARELQGARLLVIGTYRDADVGRHHPLAQTLAELAREHLAQRIVLRGLSERDVARFIEITSGSAPHAELVAAVHRETEGNPFFVNEVVRLLVSEGRLLRLEAGRSWSFGIPQSVREVIGRRLERLSEACNRTLSIAAVIGREFALDALEPLAGLPGERLLEVLEEALGARVLEEIPRSVGRYRFAHALIRETLYDELTVTRRVRLHREIGEVIERVHARSLEAHLPELAFHFLQAAPGGEVRKAIDYAVRAARRAELLHAHAQAARHYELALQAQDLLESPVEAERCELLLALGETLWRAGSVAEAREGFLRAAELARRLAAPESLARAALGYGGRLPAFETGVLNEPLVRLLEEALAALGEGRDSLRALVLARLAEALTFAPGTEARRRELSERALALARANGEPAVLCEVLRAVHFALWSPDNLEERLAQTEELLALAVKLGERATEFDARVYRVSHLLEQGAVGRADTEAERYTRLADESRQPYYVWAATAFRALEALLEGRFEEGERLANEAVGLGLRDGNPNALLIVGAHLYVLRDAQGRLAELEPSFRDLAERPPGLPVYRAAWTVLLARSGAEAQARHELARVLAPGGPELPRDWLWLGAMVLFADACALLEERAAAERLYPELLPFAGRHMMLSPVGACWGSVARPLGRLAGLLGRFAEAEAHFEAALAANQRLGARPLAAQTEAEWAELLLQRGGPGDRERATALVHRALETARELGMKALVERALALKLRAQGASAAGLEGSLDAVATTVQRRRPDLRRAAAPDGSVTLLFSDMQGFTEMTERLGDLRAHQVIGVHNRVVRQQLEANDGVELELQGDGFVLAFPEAGRALACAVAIQRAFAAREAAHPDTPIRVRIGLHSGQAIAQAEGFFGKTVIVAARVAAQANGGEILATDAVAAQVGGAARLGPPRVASLKGLSGEYRLHPVAWQP